MKQHGTAALRGPSGSHARLRLTARRLSKGARARRLPEKQPHRVRLGARFMHSVLNLGENLCVSVSQRKAQVVPCPAESRPSPSQRLRTRAMLRTRVQPRRRRYCDGLKVARVPLVTGRGDLGASRRRAANVPRHAPRPPPARCPCPDARGPP